MVSKIIPLGHVIVFLHSRDFNQTKLAKVALLSVLKLTALYHTIPMNTHTIKQLISTENTLPN